MLKIVKLFLVMTSLLVPSAIAAMQHSSNDNRRDSNESCASPASVENDVLHFIVTENNFQGFRQVATYRQSTGLEVVPGFPENPAIARSVEAVGEDGGTRELLARANLTARDYVLTGWALILAHDPAEWGLEGDRLTEQMRRNIDFVRSHRESLDAWLAE